MAGWLVTTKLMVQPGVPSWHLLDGTMQSHKKPHDNSGTTAATRTTQLPSTNPQGYQPALGLQIKSSAELELPVPLPNLNGVLPDTRTTDPITIHIIRLGLHE
jgi:hypothetical protein